MKQSKTGSAIEAISGTLLGLVVALVSQWVIFPLYGIHVSHAVDIQIVLWFTMISVVRSYLVRRMFTSSAWIDWLTVRKLNKFMRQREREMRGPSLSTESRCGCGCGAPAPRVGSLVDEHV